MRYLISLFLVSVFSFNTFSQGNLHSDYVKDSKWFLGLNAGGIWHTTDVKNKTKIGWGFMFGRSFFYNYGKPVSLDIRARFLRGVWQGQDTKMTKLSPLDPGYNGTHGTYTNYVDSAGGQTYRNFQTDVYDISLEAALHINALRERTGIDFYIFGGIGLTSYQTYGNLYRGDTLVKTMYDYNTLQNSSKASLKSFLDNSFDTPLNGSQAKKHSINIMPSIGFGIGYQITPFIQIGVEHRTTFTRGDLFDGKDYDDNLNPSKSKDLYHYTSLYLKFNFKKKAYRKNRQNNTNPPANTDSTAHTYSETSSDSNPPVAPPTCLTPQVNIVNPRSNYLTKNNRFNVAAQLSHIDNRTQISFKQNGVSNANFAFNTNTREFESNVILVPGQNIIEISARNTCGTAKDTRVITLEQERLAPPIVTFVHPSYSPFTTNNSRFALAAKFLNIQQPSQVNMLFNGQKFKTFNFNFSNHELTANLQLNEGANTVSITATNSVGSDRKAILIIYKKPFVLQAPVVQFVLPSNNPKTIATSSSAITATIFNVENSSGVFVKVNGKLMSNFNFNKSTKILNFNATSLIYGANIITVKGVNEAGEDMESTTLIYQREEPKTPPVVQFISPDASPITSSLPSYHVIALTRYVASKQDIKVRINGVPTNNFTYNSAAQTIDLQTSLLNGANVIYVQGTNEDGEEDATTTIIYKQPNLTRPPVVNIVSPQGNPAVSQYLSVPVQAIVQNVTHKDEIQVSVNGTPYSNFTFDSNTKELNFVANFMGMNMVTVKIVATNSAGTSTDSQAIKHLTRVVAKPPTLVITEPSQSGNTVQNQHYTFKAISTNVNSKSNVVVNFNGAQISPTSFDFDSSQITYNTVLVEGNNVFQASVSNVAGIVSKSTIINYKKKEIPCEKPVLTWVNLMHNATTTNDSSLTAKVQTQFVNNANELNFKLNGQYVGAVDLDTNTEIAQKSIVLSEGMNVLQMMARTSCGFKLITRTIRYEKPEAPCLVPTVNAMKPRVLDIQTQSKQVDLIASTVNVTSKEQILVKVNGDSIDFDFDTTTHTISISPALQTGDNTIKIYVSNNCGSSILTWNINRKTCEKPVFELTSGVANNTTTSDPNFDISGLVKNVVNSNDVVLKLNGNPSNFVFNPTTGSFTANFFLKKGVNTIALYLQNNCGNNIYTLKKTFVPAPTIVAPFVQIINPSRTPSTSLSSNLSVKALVQNVFNSSAITVTVNGSSVPFNFSDNTITFNQTLVDGNNAIKVYAANSAGSDSDTKIVQYEDKKIILPPIVEIINPRTSPIAIESSSFTVKGIAKNVSNTSQIQIFVNGRQITNFNSTKETGQISFDFPLVFDNFHLKYDLVVKSSNEAGTDKAVRTINKKIEINNIKQTVDDVIQTNPTMEKPTRKPILKPNTSQPRIETRPVNENVRPTGRR